MRDLDTINNIISKLDKKIYQYLNSAVELYLDIGATYKLDEAQRLSGLSIKEIIMWFV